ncbi:MAG: hypothetical protein ABEH88_02445 [Halobacteriales archaeon]
MDDSEDPERCGVGIRGVAMAIDSVVWIALFATVVILVGAASGQLQTSAGEVSSQLKGVPALAALILWLATSIGYHARLSGALAKRLGSTS